MFAITGNVLVQAKSAAVEAGCTYYMGASSSPDQIFVLAVDAMHITYVPTFEGEIRKVDRKVGEHLIATAAKRIANDSHSYRRDAHGMARQASDFDRFDVVASSVDGSDLWRDAEEYGGVMGIGDDYMIRIDGANLELLKADDRFIVKSTEQTYECPRM